MNLIIAYERERLKILYPKVKWELKDNILSWQVKNKHAFYKQNVIVNEYTIQKAIEVLEYSLQMNALAYFQGEL